MDTLLKIGELVSSAREGLDNILASQSRLTKQKIDMVRNQVQAAEKAIEELLADLDEQSSRALKAQVGEALATTPTTEAEIEAKFQKVVKVFMVTFYEVMKRQSVDNYMECKGRYDGLDRQLVLTIQWADGLSPVQKYNRHITELRVELETETAGRLAVLEQLDTLKKKIEAAPVNIKKALGWSPPRSKKKAK